ncbi:MAG TPA: hypothetical protein VL098_12575 [Flavipsychrobacter sp.]|nr:hypothetical protein [Flavipsychrobacter sp.]
MLEKPQKNPEKIFKKKANPRSSQLLPFYIVDMLLKNDEEKGKPLTVKNIQSMLVQERKGYHDLRQIYYTLNNMYCYFQSLQLEVSSARIGDTKGASFSIKKPSANEC